MDEAQGEKTCSASLWDFSEGGLGMDAPRHFEPERLMRRFLERAGLPWPGEPSPEPTPRDLATIPD